jgi:hypothetical protein
MQAEGIIGLYYERRHGELSRVHGFMKQLIATADTEVVREGSMPPFRAFCERNRLISFCGA